MIKFYGLLLGLATANDLTDLYAHEELFIVAAKNWGPATIP